MLLSIQSHSSECHTLVMNGALGKELVASQRTQDRNKIQPDSDKGIGTGLVTVTQSLQKYREVHSEAHVDVNAINLIVNFIALQTANLSDGHWIGASCRWPGCPLSYRCQSYLRVIRNKQVVSFIIKFLTWQLSIDRVYFLHLSLSHKKLSFKLFITLCSYIIMIIFLICHEPHCLDGRSGIEAVESSWSSNTNADLGLADQQGARKLWIRASSWAQGAGVGGGSAVSSPGCQDLELSLGHSVHLWSLPS